MLLVRVRNHKRDPPLSAMQPGLANGSASARDRDGVGHNRRRPVGRHGISDPGNRQYHARTRQRLNHRIYRDTARGGDDLWYSRTGTRDWPHEYKRRAVAGHFRTIQSAAVYGRTCNRTRDGRTYRILLVSGVILSHEHQESNKGQRCCSAASVAYFPEPEFFFLSKYILIPPPIIIRIPTTNRISSITSLLSAQNANEGFISYKLMFVTLTEGTIPVKPDAGNS